MPGQYSTHCGRRPCPGDAEAEGIPGRLFLCVRCRTQVLICSHCDRGQIYCRDGCAREARYHAQRAAGRRYQTSRRYHCLIHDQMKRRQSRVGQGRPNVSGGEQRRSCGRNGDRGAGVSRFRFPSTL
jgi:hypothetical protein